MNEKMWPIIYLDLDETLVYTRFCSSQEPKNIPIDSYSFELDGYWYLTQLRACTLDLISYCRSLSIVKILTAATKDYTMNICDHFNLGFEEDEIIDRYEYCKYIRDGCTGYGGGMRETCVSLDSIGHINSILIDNQDLNQMNARIKREWLGIDRSRYIKFPEWDGEEEVPNLAELIDVVKTRTALLVNDILKK